MDSPVSERFQQAMEACDSGHDQDAWIGSGISERLVGAGVESGLFRCIGTCSSAKELVRITPVVEQQFARTTLCLI